MDTKELVLNKLEKSKGKPISGSVIANSLGISRTAVWKAISSLREEGHEITAGSGRGYILSEDSDKLTLEGIRLSMSRDIEIICLDTVDSTNKEAMRRAIDDPKGISLIVSNNQTEGRGRLGRKFYSPADTGVYLSFLFKPNFDISRSVPVTTAAATAVCRAIENVTGNSCDIKWVNDIYFDGKKIAGILTEAVSGFETGTIDYLIVGIGINCKTTEFPSEAGENPGALTGKFSRNKLVAEIANCFLPMTEDMNPDMFIQYYREHSLLIGKNIYIYKFGEFGCKDANPKKAFVTGIRSDGGLMVRYDDGLNDVITSGEVTVRPVAGKP